MRVAVLSDVHGNLHALEAVLAALAQERIDAVWCLGDVVGYGPQPNACCKLVAGRTELCLAGNHDLGVLGTVDLADFSDEAAVSARWTRDVLDDEPRTFLEGLEPSGRAEGAQLFHASPRDPVWEYILSGDAVADALARTEAPVVLVGHSHVALAVTDGPDGLDGGAVSGGTEVDLSAGRWLLNPGSVGQPRDGDPRAAFLVLDLGAGRAVFHRVEYPIARTQAEIRERGLPALLAERLAHGV